MKTSLIAVIGDVHHHIGLAVEGIERMESELNRPVDQVFSVGDLGLFLDKSDWGFLTGPKKYRVPEESPEICRAWKKWRWPLSAIAGNHEPFNRYRAWDAAYFSFRLEYTNAGELPHQLPDLRVAGLSGIYNPQQMEFVSALEARTFNLSRGVSWTEMVWLAETNKISRSRLTYYKELEVESLKAIGFTPHLLLLHDWPTAPTHISQIYPRRPEAEIVEALRPEFVCCGHHHTASDFFCGPTRILTLNIISRKDLIHRHFICPGWSALFEWDGESLKFLQPWPMQ
ncbi:MAG: metallophosphoesterase [Verrucomicrobiota bacterium]